MDLGVVLQTLLTVAITLVSVAAGAYLNDRTGRSRESRQLRSEGDALRMLLDLEIHSNLVSLRELYDAIISSEATIGTLETAEDITIGPSRLVGKNAWSQQSTRMIVSMSPEEIQRIHELYLHYDIVALVHGFLRESVQHLEEADDHGRATRGSVDRRRRLSHDVSAAMVDLKRTMFKLLTEGNPLRPGEQYAFGLDVADVDRFVGDTAQVGRATDEAA